MTSSHKSIREIVFLLVVFIAASGIQQMTCTDERPGLCWTRWLNRYKANEGMDLETFSRLDAIRNRICFRPFAIDYARVDGQPVVAKLDCNFYGCTCRDIKQKPGIYCGDYKVRFLCPCEHSKGGGFLSNDFMICDNEETKTIRCPGTLIIRVDSAYFGNLWLSRCGLGSMVPSCRQESSRTLQVISALCNDKKTCTVDLSAIHASNLRCTGVVPRLHLQYSCEAIARAPGNRVGKPGDVYTDPSCKYKCVFLMSNRIICLPVCPVHFGFSCPIGSVVRWTTKPFATTGHCQCRIPQCVTPGNSCTVNKVLYKQNEVFELGCQEECTCLGKNDIKCVPLCPASQMKCHENSVLTTLTETTKYPHCSCKVVKCVIN